jgi:hypothetical protein
LIIGIGGNAASESKENHLGLINWKSVNLAETTEEDISDLDRHGNLIGVCWL